MFACLESAEDDVSRRRNSSDDLDDTSDESVFEYIIKAGDDLGVRAEGEVPRLARVADAMWVSRR